MPHTTPHRRPRRVAVCAGIAALVVLLSACSDNGDDDPVAEPTETSTPTPTLSAPPTKTPEEQAEEEIKATFKQLIADRDEYYSNTSDYDRDEVATNAPSTEWRVTGQADLELSNWTRAWLTTEVEQVGDTIIATHEVTNVDLTSSDSGFYEASSTACMDLQDLSFQTYDGEPANDVFEPDTYQTWEMTWLYFPNAGPDEGEEAGWYVQTIDLTRNQPC